jgi:hypothetical protein
MRMHQCMRRYDRRMLTHRLHILLDEDRWQRLDREASRRRVPVAAVVRDAIDLAVPGTDAEARRAAADAILHAEPMPVPDDPADLRRELDEIRSRGL